MKTQNILLISALPLVGSATMQAQPTEKYNVLFIAADDMRPNLSCYGDPHAITPNIDRIAAKGMVFKQAYCQQAVSNASRASILTGLRPDENGVTDLETFFRDKVPDVVTLPQCFKNNGYTAISVGKIFHALPHTLDHISWDVEIGAPEGTAGYLLPENKKGKGRLGKTSLWECADVADNEYIDGYSTDEAIKQLRKNAKSEKPFFLAVGYKKPHAPYCAPKKYWDLYENMNYEITHQGVVEECASLAYHGNVEIRGYSNIPDEGPIPSDAEQMAIRGYYACISYVDAQIGMILDELDALDLSDNTVIVFWGDHGYHLGEQDLWCKSTNFELDARVPLIISTPEMRAKGTHCSAIVEFVDVYPTLLDICQVPAAGKLSGASLKKLLDNPEAKWNDVAFSQFIRPYKALRKRNPTHMGYSVRVPDWRCTYWYDLSNGELVEKELYSLKYDSIERKNVSGKSEYRKIEKKLAELIERYRSGNYKK